MNKIYITLLSLFAVAATSCSDFLDVRPSGEKVENEQFETAKGFEDAIFGVYGYMTESALYGKDMVWGVPEVLAQNLRSGATSMEELAKYNYKNNESLRTTFSNMWAKAYSAIGYANNILQNLDKKDPSSFPLYNMYKGEMLGVRAMIHFDLLRLFASTDPSKQGIPYVTTFSQTVKPFSTVGVCLENIIKDLTEAESLLKDGETIVYPRNNERYERFNNGRETHINRYAVKALLARVYWYSGNNAEAARYASEVIESGLFPLVEPTEVQAHIAGVLSPKETIFGLYSQTYLETSTSFLYTWQSYHTYHAYNDLGSSNYPQSWQKLYNLDVPATAQDFRKNWIRENNSLSLCMKMVDYLTIENGNSPARPSLISGISLINASEMYLIAADALLATDYNKAVRYFNTEMVSRGLSPLASEEQLTANRIFNEYHKEMFGEGQHWFNMKRTKADIISNAESRTIPANDDIYVLPIPEEEFEYRPEGNK